MLEDVVIPERILITGIGLTKSFFLLNTVLLGPEISINKPSQDPTTV